MTRSEVNAIIVAITESSISGSVVAGEKQGQVIVQPIKQYIFTELECIILQGISNRFKRMALFGGGGTEYFRIW